MDKGIYTRVFVNVPVRAELEKRISRVAARKNISRAALMRLAVSEYLEREELRSKERTDNPPVDVKAER